MNTLRLMWDEWYESPREYAILTKMVCFHNRYELGDKQSDYRSEDYCSWDDLRMAIVKSEDPAVILPLYLYDHSGLVMSVGPFSCPWDSGQVGWIFIPKKEARREYNVKRISKKLREKMENILIAEVEEYNCYLQGDCYRAYIEDNEEETVDECGGFWGSNPIKNGLVEFVAPYFDELTSEQIVDLCNEKIKETWK